MSSTEEEAASAVVGLLCAVGSAVFNGSFAVLFKTDKMVRLNIHPMTFQLYVCLGIFFSSLLTMLFWEDDNQEGQENMTLQSSFTVWGFVAGGLFVCAVSASFFAIAVIGVALAQGIWGGGAMVVSYLWGALVFGEIPQHIYLSIAGLLLLVGGVLLIAFCETIAQKWKNRNNNYTPLPLASQEQKGDRSPPPDRSSSVSESTTTATTSNNSTISPQAYARGILWASAVGIFGGSILAPMHYVPESKQGLIFLPSFGLGCLIVSPTVFGLYCSSCFVGSRRQRPIPQLHVREALLTGLLSGLIWNVGNLLSIFAIPIITYGVAYPIMQCAILVSGLWGIYAFHEITDPSTIQVFWLGGATLVLGGGVLALSQ